MCDVVHPTRRAHSTVWYDCAGLMGKPGKLREIVRSMHSILTCPLTLKMRTGLETDVAQRFAHKVVSKVRIWSAAESAVGAHDRFSFSHADGGDGSGRSLLDAVTIHGRTRQQRYSKYADWEYVKDVVRVSAAGSMRQQLAAGWQSRLCRSTRWHEGSFCTPPAPCCHCTQCRLRRHPTSWRRVTCCSRPSRCQLQRLTACGRATTQQPCRPCRRRMGQMP